MQISLQQTDENIREEARKIIYERGLDNILHFYGIPHYTGSYALQLMTWRDLDIYVETNNLDVTNFFELGKKIASAFEPVKMSFRNEIILKTPGLPTGLYWGVYLGDERNGAWKIDIWAMMPGDCRQRLEYCNNLSKQISASQKISILNIKSQCWKDPAYRKTFSSNDIYNAVLKHAVTDIEGFKKYLATK